MRPTMLTLKPIGFTVLACLYAATVQSLAIESEILGSNSTSATRVASVCKQIARTVSRASAVFYPKLGFDANYKLDIQHWATTSTQESVCSVEPGSAADVAKIIRILGATRTPFAVKGGGHIMNPGFSSTTGVTITMSRFNQTIYSAASQTAVIGAGLIWDDVYAALEPYNMSVVGGRVSGVGVAGFTLGGGYSWLTNERGLTIDNVVGFNLVKPDGSIALVTSRSDTELFFSLKGGYNNFGIVTSFVMKTFPQGPVWGGQVSVGQSSFAALNKATAAFFENITDPKAGIIVTYNAFIGIEVTTVLIFYNGPKPPAAIFKAFVALGGANSLKTRSLLDLVQSTPSDLGAGFAGRFNTVPLQAISLEMMTQIQNQTSFYSKSLSTGIFASGILVSYDVEPFLPSILTHAPEGSSAYPASRSTKALLPLNIYFSWSNPAASAQFIKAIKDSTALLTAQALREGQDLTTPSFYPNYCLEDTPLELMYGAGHLARMRAVRRRVDPDGVMKLAGGFKI